MSEDTRAIKNLVIALFDNDIAGVSTGYWSPREVTTAVDIFLNREGKFLKPAMLQTLLLKGLHPAEIDASIPPGRVSPLESVLLHVIDISSALSKGEDVEEFLQGFASSDELLMLAGEMYRSGFRNVHDPDAVDMLQTELRWSFLRQTWVNAVVNTPSTRE